MMLAKKVISQNSTCYNQKITLQEASEIILSGTSSIPVVDVTAKVKGVLTTKSICAALLEGASLYSSVDDYLEEAVLIHEDTLINGLLKSPLEKVIVVDERQRFLGTISLEVLVGELLHERDKVSGNLNAILAATNNCIVSIDNNGNISYLNARSEKLLCTSVQDAVGKPVNTFIPTSRLPEIIKTGEPELWQKFIYEDKIFITNRTPIMQKGKIVGALAVFQDITELEKAIEELDSVKRYKDILETVVENDYDCIVVVDSEGIITMFNKAYQEFIGVSREKAIGKHVTQVIENTRMHLVAKTGLPEMGEIQKIAGHDMICNRVPIKKDGKVWGAIGKVMFKDVKDYKEFVDKISRLQIELDYYKDIVNRIQGPRFSFDNIIGRSPEMLEIKAMAMRVAQSNSTVLIRGESGTGKELFANSIHYASLRKNGPFVKVNCSAIPENLLESELFGYDEGAFTGAKKGGKIGKFELAHKGTILLDEIGDMPLNMQIKILRVIQEKEIERVGATSTISVDVRVIAATNRNLEELINEGKFRLDLYYRLNVVELKIPSLRQHKSDLEELLYYHLGKISSKMGYPTPSIDQEALGHIMNYDWPGNVREMENVLERCLNFIDNNVIKATNLPYHMRNLKQGKESNAHELRDHLEETERLAIINVLKMSGGNKVKAAKMLGISRASIYQKIDKYKIG